MRTRRYVLFAGVALAASAAVVLALLDPGDANLSNATTRNAASQDAPSSPPPAAASPTETSRSLTAQRTDALAVEWNDASHDVVGPVVEGTIVVTDRDGGKHDEESGSFVPDFIDGQDSDLEEGARRRVAVKHGRFRFDGRGATVMLVEEVELGGRPAAVDRGVEFTPGEPVTVPARWIDDLLLHAVDAATKRELSGVTVARVTGRGATAHPGLLASVDVVVDDARSPFHVKRESSIEQVLLGGAVWIGARGHVWQSVTLEFGREAERTVELAAAGALAVVVTEPADAAAGELDGRSLRELSPRLRLRSASADAAGLLVADVASFASTFHFEGLEPGPLVASIEVGSPFPTPRVVSRAAVAIAAGATAHATLVFDASKAPRPATLAGTIYVPPAWGDTIDQVDVEPVFLRGGMPGDAARTRAALEPIAGRPGWNEWSISPILPATYRIEVELAGFAATVAVGPEGRTGVTLTLPEPALLRVRVVDIETQEPVEVGHVLWCEITEPDRDDPRSGQEIPIFRPETMLRWDAASACCFGAVRPGRGRIRGFDLDVGASLVFDSDEVFTVEAGENELVLRGHAPCGVDLEIVSSGDHQSLVEVDWRRLDATGPDANGLRGVRFVSGTDSEPRIVLPGPGRYRLTYGFRFLRGDSGKRGSFDVDVAKGEFVKKTLEVDR